MENSKDVVPIAKSDNSELNYNAFYFRQRGDSSPALVMFSAPVGELLGIAEVDQLGPRSLGPQREQKEARVQAIKKFLSSDEQNTIPSAVILAFKQGKAKFKPVTSSSVGILEIERTGMVATIVDGQHRLYGLKLFNPETLVAVVGLLDADEVERAFQFLVINNKSSKVPATHTKALLAKMKSTELLKRLRGAKIAFDAEGINDIDLVNSDRESPFYRSIDWTTTPEADRMVQATAIELSLDYLGGIGLPELEDRDVRRSVFLTIWKTIKDQWNNLWVKDSHLISKVGIYCLTRSIIDRLASWADNDELDIDITDLEQVEEQTKKIIQYMDTRFWAASWAENAKGGFDTNQGRERVMSAIRQLYRNGRRDIAWHTDIDIVEHSTVANED